VPEGRRAQRILAVAASLLGCRLHAAQPGLRGRILAALFSVWPLWQQASGKRRFSGNPETVNGN